MHQINEFLIGYGIISEKYLTLSNIGYIINITNVG